MPADGGDDAFATAEAGEWRVRFHGGEPGAKLYALALVPRGGYPLQPGLDRGDGAANRLLAADPRFVAAILPALPGGPEPACRVTLTASGGKRGTVSYGPFADRFDWTVGESHEPARRNVRFC